MQAYFQAASELSGRATGRHDNLAQSGMHGIGRAVSNGKAQAGHNLCGDSHQQQPGALCHLLREVQQLAQLILLEPCVCRAACGQQLHPTAQAHVNHHLQRSTALLAQGSHLAAQHTVHSASGQAGSGPHGMLGWDYSTVASIDLHSAYAALL